MKRFVLFILFTTTAFATIKGQPNLVSKGGYFKVDQIKGCFPFTVTITDTNLLTTGECTGGKPCIMSFEPNQVCSAPLCQNQTTYTYTTPGVYKLSVQYQSNEPDEITITVVDNTLPSFELYSCAGSKVFVKITDNKYQQYATNFGDGNPETKQPFQNVMTEQHSYAPGQYTISVRGINIEAADNCKTNTQAFAAVAALPPPAINTLTAIDAGTLKLDFPAQPNMQLRSEIAVDNATTFQQYQNLYGLSTTNMPSLRVDDRYYCFRLNNYDPCANTNNYSSPVCSQNFDLSIENGVNKLNWATASTGIASTDINRNKTLLTNTPGLPALPYSDVDIICKTNYCYQVISNYAGGAKSISLEKCGDAFTTLLPPQINNVSSIVGNPQGIELNWLVDPAINTPEFNVFRAGSGGAYQLIATTKDTKLQDPDYKTEETYCYRINYTDACGNISPSGEPVCPITLTGVLGEKNIADVLWNGYNGWINGVNHYVLEKYNTSGQLLGTVDLGTSVNYKDDPADPVNQVIRYVVKAYANETGVTLSSSNQIEIAKSTNLFSPTAFTPNGDNLNDNFVVIGYYITKLKLKIFDRWGALIFTTDNNEPWNGTRSGSGVPLPTGTYVWKAELTDFAGQTFSEEGTVMLIRKNN